VGVQVSPDDIDENLRDNLEHYMHCAGVPEFAEVSRAPPFNDLVLKYCWCDPAASGFKVKQE